MQKPIVIHFQNIDWQQVQMKKKSIIHLGDNIPWNQYIQIKYLGLFQVTI